jgi:beta-phosphoglucomutase-like phosphatase (HAD superfamily)
VARAALLDVDGTLIDSNYQHALAWYRAFRRFEIVLPVWRLDRHIGMGGDHYVAAVAGDEVEQRLGDDLRDAQGDEFERIRDECEPLEGAAELLRELKRRSFSVVLASSSNEDDLKFFVGKLGADDCIDRWTSKNDVERTKPHADQSRLRSRRPAQTQA